MMKKPRRMEKAISDRITSFMEAWKQRNWPEMFEHCQLTWKEGHTSGELGKVFGNETYHLTGYEIKGHSNLSSVRQTVLMDLTFSDGRVCHHAANLLCEARPYKTATYGTWGVNPISVLRNLGTVVQPKPKKNEGQKKTGV